MLIIPLDKLEIAKNRQRREFEPQELANLAESIEKHGLMHPLVVRPKEGTDDAWVLVAGERRLRAIRDYLWPMGGLLKCGGDPIAEDSIAVVPLGDLDELSAEEAELEENVQRTDLSWQERAAASARLADLRRKQAEKEGREAPSVADISLEIRGSAEGINHENTRREIILAKHLGNPAVAAAKSLQDAWKTLKREEVTQRNIAIAETIGKTFTADSHELFNTEALGWLWKCPFAQFDVILTDPPYGIDADEFGDSGGIAAGAHQYEDSYEYWLKLMSTFAPVSFVVAKPMAHLYCFVDIDNFVRAKALFADCGWQVHRTPIIWHKPGGSRVPWPEHGPQRKYEMVLYAVKGKKPVTQIYPDVVSYNPDENLGHMAQKPVALYADLLKRSTTPGDVVCDPFCGTGPIFPAAHGLKCRAVGVERDPSAYGIALTRIQQLKETT